MRAFARIVSCLIAAALLAAAAGTRSLAGAAAAATPGAPGAAAVEPRAEPPSAPATAPAAPSQALEEDEPEVPLAPFLPRPGIVWRAWTSQVFQVAKDLDRPILLFLTNPWNTLGAVMDANTFTDERVVGVIRELFIPVRVDVDRRPDVEERFGTGGLPGVAILMPSGESMYLKTPRGNYMRAGATYLTADEMVHYLRSIADYYRANRPIMDLRIADIVERFKQAENRLSAPLDAGVIEAVASALREQFDRTHGGWGLSPKAPDAQTLLLCWHLVRQRDDTEARDMGLRTLRAIWDSPLHDRIEGGVFRLAMERDWSAPRYEKVLEPNARLLEAMAEGVLATGEAWLAEAAREQADFLQRVLAHPEGGFKRAQGPGDLEATYFALGRRARRKAEAPFVEPARIVSWNAHAVSALLRSYQALGEDRYRESALRALEFLVARCRIGSRGTAHVFDGRPQMSGLLVDQVAMARALLDAYQVEGHQRHLREAMELAATARTFFRDTESPRFVDRVQDPRLLGAMTRPDRDLVDNSEMAMVLLDLSALTGDPGLAEEARQILEAYADEVGIYGTYAAPLARAVDRALRSPVRLVLWRGGEEERARGLARAAAGLRHPRVLVDWLDGRVTGRLSEEEFRLLAAEDGAASLLAGYGRRSALLRTPEEVRRAIRSFEPEKLPTPPSRGGRPAARPGAPGPRPDAPPASQPEEPPQTRPS